MTIKIYKNNNDFCLHRYRLNSVFHVGCKKFFQVLFFPSVPRYVLPELLAWLSSAFIFILSLVQVYSSVYLLCSLHIFSDGIVARGMALLFLHSFRPFGYPF